MKVGTFGCSVEDEEVRVRHTSETGFVHDTLRQAILGITVMLTPLVALKGQAGIYMGLHDVLIASHVLQTYRTERVTIARKPSDIVLFFILCHVTQFEMPLFSMTFDVVDDLGTELESVGWV
jgi:hypothetical protein